MNKYYKQYLENHKHPKVKLMHFIGNLVTLDYIVWVVVNQRWMMLLLAPFVVYPFALAGHFIFGPKGNKPSFYKMPFLWAKLCDIKMCYEIVLFKHKIF